MEQNLVEKKEIKRDGRRMGLAVLLYAVINLLVSAAWLVGEFLVKAIPQIANVTDPAEGERIVKTVLESLMESGTCMIVGVMAGVLFLLLFFRKQGVHKQLFKSERKMTPGRFAAMACVFFGGQLVFSLGYELMEAGLNLVGFSAESAMEMATGSSKTLSMFLYAGIIGPIAEELVYRGFLMRHLEKHGKTLAIVVTSILFGVMHGNLPQALFATCVGLVLGYVAMEYSILWSILLHILNNMVLADLLPMALKGFSEQTQGIVTLVINGVFLVIGVVVLIVKRKELISWIRTNAWEKPRMKWILMNVSTIIFIAAHLLLAVFTLTKI